MSLATTRGLVAWLSPASAADYTLSGSNVTQIRNKVSSVNWPVTGTLTVDPVGLNGRPAFALTGSQRCDTTEAAVVAALASGSPHTIYFFAQYGNADATETIISTGNSGASGVSIKGWGKSSSGVGTLARIFTTNDAGVITSTGSARRGDLLPHLQTWTSAGTTESLKVDGNEGADIFNAPTSALPITTNIVGLWCNRDSTPDTFFTGFFGDVLICNVEHTQAEIEAVYQLVAAAYGTLPAPPPPVVLNPNVIDVIFMTGQSNASGYAPAEQMPRLPVPTVYRWPYTYEAYSVDPPLVPSTPPDALVPLSEIYQPEFDAEFHGVDIGVARRLQEIGLQPLVFMCSAAGRPLKNTWNPVPTYGLVWPILVDEWAKFQTAAAAMYPGKVLRVHIIWIQGEWEAGGTVDGPTALTYEDDLIRLINEGWRSPTGLNMTAAHVYIWRLNSDLDTGAGPVIRAAHESVAAALPNCHIISTDGAPRLLNSLHYSSSGYGVMADRMTASILATLPTTLPEADMGTLSTELRNRLINHALGVATYTPPATISLAAFVAGVEVSGNGYTRLVVANNGTTWSAAASRLKTNAIRLEFAAATGAWGSVDEIRGYNTSTGEEMFADALASAIAVPSGNALVLAAGAIDIVAASGGLTNTYMHSLLNLAFGATAYTAETSLRIAYFNGDPQVAGVETSGTGYARAAPNNNGTTWAAAASGYARNQIAFSLGTAGADWTAATYLAIFNAAGSGLMLSAPLPETRMVLSGETEVIQATRVRPQLL